MGLGDAVDNWPAVRHAIRTAMKHADGVRTLIIRDAEPIAKHAETLSTELQDLGMDSREALATAALTAGWHWWGIDSKDVLAKDKDDLNRTDATDLLSAILEMPVRTPGGPGKSVARGLLDDHAAIADIYGLLYDERGLLIHYNHTGLVDGLSRTQWGRANLRGILTQLPGATLTNPVRIGAARVRTLLVPPATLHNLGIDLVLNAKADDEDAG